MGKLTETAIVVIRSSEERSLQACLNSVLLQTDKNNLRIIQERPFENALRKSFKLGIESGKRWLITLDADVLLFPNVLNDLLAAAEQMPETYVEIGARIFDKVFGAYRLAGNRVYRVSILQKALSCIPEIGTEIRPETATLKKLAEFGHSNRKIGLVMGIHDFEQFYGDLYRKAFVHGQKHYYLAGDLLKRCLKKKAADPDFAVILKGFCDGIVSTEKATIDAGRFRDAADAALKELGLLEKPPFYLRNFQNIDNWILSQLECEPPEFVTRDRPPTKSTISGIKNRFDELVFKHGFLAATKYSIGSTFEKIGKYLKNYPKPLYM